MTKLDDVKKLIEEKRYEEAQHILQLLDSQGLGNAESQYLLGLIFHSRNDIAKAVESFKRALIHDPDYIDASISLSIIYNDTGHYAEGKKLFEKAEKSLARKPLNSTPSMILNKEISKKHTEAGDMYRKIERYDDAANEYHKAIRIDADNLDAQVNLAKTMANRGQLQIAYQELQKMIQKYPQYVPIRIQLALLYFANGNFVDAQMELSQVLQQDPDNSQAQMYLSMAKDATESTI
jgi:tetratricopeptide (TPR) repeat protein